MSSPPRAWKDRPASCSTSSFPGRAGSTSSASSRAGRTIPIIFLTGRGSIPMSVRAMKEGAVEFLTKPVRPRELLAAIRAAIAGDRASQAAAPRAGGTARAVRTAYGTRARSDGARRRRAAQQADRRRGRGVGANSQVPPRARHEEDAGRVARGTRAHGDTSRPRYLQRARTCPRRQVGRCTKRQLTRAASTHLACGHDDTLCLARRRRSARARRDRGRRRLRAAAPSRGPYRPGVARASRGGSHARFAVCFDARMPRRAWLRHVPHGDVLGAGERHTAVLRDASRARRRACARRSDPPERRGGHPRRALEHAAGTALGGALATRCSTIPIGGMSAPLARRSRRRDSTGLSS